MGWGYNHGQWWRNLVGGNQDAVNSMIDTYGDMQNANTGYRETMEGTPGMEGTGILNNSPQIDLSQYINDINRYAGLLMKESSGYADLYQGYRDIANEYSGSMLDEYLGSASEIEDVSKTALDKSLGSYDKYLSANRKLAQGDMPGLDVYRGQIGNQSAQSIDRLKDVGGLSAGSFSNVLSGQNDQLRQLAVQSGQYRAQRQEQMANAYATYGNMTGQAYGQRVSGLATAAGLRGAGYSGAAGIQQGLGMGATNAEVGMRQNAITGAANLTGAGAGLAQSQFNFNEFMPYQNRVDYYTNQVNQTNPYLAGMSMYGNMAAMQAAQQQAMVNSATSMYTGMQNQAAQAAGTMVGMPGLGSSGGYNAPYTSGWEGMGSGYSH
jgi:hypothetical protein